MMSATYLFQVWDEACSDSHEVFNALEVLEDDVGLLNAASDDAPLAVVARRTKKSTVKPGGAASGKPDGVTIANENATANATASEAAEDGV